MFPHEDRLDAARTGLCDAGATALVCGPGPDARYLSGWDASPSERLALLVVPATEPPALLVPELEAAAVRASTPVTEVRTWPDEADPTDALADLVAARGLDDGAHLLVDDRLWARHLLALRGVAPSATLGSASEVLAPLRRRKDAAELDALRRAARIADDVLDGLRDEADAVVGLTETELARRIERRLLDAGGEGLPFEPVVAAGPNGARPHHAHGDREIRAGEPVVLDFGTVVDGYPSDQTRTLVLGGEASDRFSRIHDLVREAGEAAIDAVEPGVTAGAVDRAARDPIAAAGHGDAFVHRTGHGVGLEVHEEPYVVAGSEVVLEPGDVFSVEPGVYLHGEFGVRVEDLVVVTDEGVERLNRTDRGYR